MPPAHQPVGAAEAPSPGMAEDERDSGLEEFLRTGHFFGRAHGIKRSLRRYAADAGQAAPSNETCTKHSYNAGKRTPGEWAMHESAWCTASQHWVIAVNGNCIRL